ncbi:MAG: NADH-quinone oxidoreductase subunit C [Burkholderia sp.]|nr:NADH-quinone oxidoreductase subunit C [Burkholderia sp.]
MATKIDTLRENLKTVLDTLIMNLTEALGELTLVVKISDYIKVAQILRDDHKLQFEQLIDLCGVDYKSYGNGVYNGLRFSVVSHLLSLKNNWRLRLRVFAQDDDMPIVPSLFYIWNSVNWYEREAFDLYGIVFDGHPDLRRILTDYGFIGHPFRKDFPMSGYVEMNYDKEKKRVVYQPVTIEPREITPRVIREDHYSRLYKN